MNKVNDAIVLDILTNYLQDTSLWTWYQESPCLAWTVLASYYTNSQDNEHPEMEMNNSQRSQNRILASNCGYTKRGYTKNPSLQLKRFRSAAYKLSQHS